MIALRALPCCLLVLLLGGLPGIIQEAPSQSSPSADTTAPADSVWHLDMDPIVVTATRSERAADEVAVPVSVIGQDEMEVQGAARVTGVLSAQPGLTINNDHGAGLQMRGLGAEYTLILIDGEPVIGRTAGTLDLDRLTTANVERVEVVRGPTSSLYGSEALAGVVNLITKRPGEPLRTEVRSRYGTHGTVDLSARLEGTSGAWQGSAFVNRYRTDGYDLAPQTMTPTRPGYVDYTAQAQGQYEAGARTTLSFQGRLATQSQDYTTGVGEAGTSGEVPHTQTAQRLDWNVSSEIGRQLGAGWQLTSTLYGAGFHTEQTLRRTVDQTVRSASALDQYHGKAEAVLRGALGSGHLFTVGGGAVFERIDADRKTGRRHGGFGFVQDEWSPADPFEVTGSLRLDANSDYASQLSPKLSVRYAPFDRLSLRASVGSGYKAPAFRQLYLDFTNPQAGYTVLGATKVQEGIQRLQERGQIETLFREPGSLGDPLRPESSYAFNVGMTTTLTSGVTLDLNLYHNEVDNLVDTEPVAAKSNGRQVYTYVNRNEVFTRGTEARLTLHPMEAFEIRVGYDYLQARDREVLEALANGEVFRRENGRDVQVTVSDYGGLPGRSAHSGTVQLRHTALPLGFTASVRGKLRGRYGDADRNGNGIIDVDREYVEARTLWDVTLSKTIYDDYTLRMGGENLLGYTNPRRVPSLSGRQWFVEVQARF